MGFFQDNLLPFLKKNELVFLERRKESEGVYSFLFEKKTDLTWKAGQYGLFSITHKAIKNATRPFSVSSAPEENIVKITTCISDTPSDFKKSLFELEKGMNVSMRGPVGPFYLKENSPALLIAGGIGITPFRAILKKIVADGNEEGQPIHLLYMDSEQSYLFKSELDEMAKHSAINVTYLDTRDGLYQEIDKFTVSNPNNGHYFIAGPKAMVSDVSDYLKHQKIANQKIHKDAFFGY